MWQPKNSGSRSPVPYEGAERNDGARRSNEGAAATPGRAVEAPTSLPSGPAAARRLQFAAIFVVQPPAISAGCRRPSAGAADHFGLGGGGSPLINVDSPRIEFFGGGRLL